MDDEVIEFLDMVWGRPGKSVWVDLPSKAGGHWIPYNMEWPDDRTLARRRVENCLEDGEDIYFSVATFRGRGRRIADVLPTSWLWADLDTVDPVFLDEDGVLPTVAWESSPGRYQCLWQLSVRLMPDQQTRLNRALTTAIGADRGGYDLTQVLRPPGTRNFKYGDGVSAPTVQMMWDLSGLEGYVYKPSEIVASVRAMGHDLDAKRRTASATEQAARVSVNFKKLPARARRLLNTPADHVVEGERSTRLYELNRLLLEHGLDEDTVYELVARTPWHKWKDVSSGDERLRADIAKAAAKIDRGNGDLQSHRVRRGTSDSEAPVRRQRKDPGSVIQAEPDKGRSTSSDVFVDYASFISSPIETPRWLVENIWSGGSHGFIAGEPKTGKSILAMALGLSVASGRPFLGNEEFKVKETGPVIMIQEENAPWVTQDRMRKIAQMYGLIGEGEVEVTKAPEGSLAKEIVRLDFPSDVPLKMLNNYSFSLLDEEHREILEYAIQEYGTKMLVLDPFYLVAPGVNVNSSADVVPIMKYLLDIRYKLDCAVVVVHHWSKASEVNSAAGGRRPGQRMMGSGLLHGWVESAMYCEALDASGAGEVGTLRCRVQREFRNVGPKTGLEVEMLLGEPGDMYGMRASIRDWNMGGLIDSVLEKSGGEIPLRKLAIELGELRGDASATETRRVMQKVKKMAVGAGFFAVRNGKGAGTRWTISSQASE